MHPIVAQADGLGALLAIAQAVNSLNGQPVEEIQAALKSLQDERAALVVEQAAFGPQVEEAAAAKAEAEELMARAQKELADVAEQSKALTIARNQFESVCNTRIDNVREREDRCNSREVELRAREEQVAQREVDVAKARQEADAIRREFEDRMAKLKAV